MATPTTEDVRATLAAMDPEQLPVPKHRLKSSGHFAGLYAAEHVAATEFVFGATFVSLGAGIWDILIGLLIGNTLAILSFWLITTPIAMQARLSLYTYLHKIAGDSFSRVYNGANAVIFAVIAAAMLTVSATAVRRIFNIPAQVDPYPNHIGFVIIAVLFSVVAVLVAVFGFNALAEFAGICGPWLMVMFTVGGMVLLPALTESITGYTTLNGFSDFVDVASASVFTGINAEGQPGIGLLEVAGFAWAANTFAHFGLIDMALLRYAKNQSAGLATSTGMMFGHYVAWISAGMMGAATAVILQTSIVSLDPGDVAWYALGIAGFVTVIVAGWTTANSNLYRAGLAAQAVFPQFSRVKVTLVTGIGVAVASCFPFIYINLLPLLTYAGVILVPVGGIVLAEHHLFPRLGLTRFWYRYKGDKHNVPALLSWAISLLAAVGMILLDFMPYFYIFLPTWLISIMAYTWLAKRFGAGESYPEGEAREQEFQAQVAEYHESLAEEEGVESIKDTTLLGRGIKVVYIAALVVCLAQAWRTLFDSPDLYTYLVNRETFYTVALCSTIVYFVFAYWGLQRTKRLTARLKEERPGPPKDTTAPRL